MLSCEWIALGRHGCSRRPRLSIMKLHRIKQTRGWPWLFLSLYLRARGGSRARVSRTCTGAPVGFPIIGWQADDSVQRTHETRTSERVSLTPSDLHIPLSRHPFALHHRSVPLEHTILHVHTYRDHATSHAPCHTLCPRHFIHLWRFIQLYAGVALYR